MKLILSRLLSVMYINEVSYFAVLSDRCLDLILFADKIYHNELDSNSKKMPMK
jgi:hypothetical protein